MKRNLHLKIILNARSIDAHHALEIVSWWRAQRVAAVNVVKAIRMFYALTQGDASLLREYFPGLGIGIASAPPIAPALPAPNGKHTPMIEASVKSMQELTDDLFSF